MDAYSSETGNSSTLNRPPVLLAASSSAAMMRAERPDSQFFTVPTVYRISVTLSTIIFPNWFIRRDGQEAPAGYSPTDA